MPKLIAAKGPTMGREYKLEELCILGRSPSCQIYIGDLTVSRQHARITRTDRGFIVEDLGSGNGTWVNDSRVSQHLLQDTDEIRISESVFRFVEEKKPEAQKWVNMVTVVAGNEPGLISSQGTDPKILFKTLEHTNEKDLRADLSRAHRMLETLYAAANVTSSVLDPKRLLNKILDHLLNVVPDADLGYIMLLDDQNQLVPRAIRRQRGAGPPSGGLVISQSVVSQVMHEGKAVLSQGDSEGSRTGTRSSWGRAASKMCAPLTAQGKNQGILHIEGTPGGRPFTQEDLDLLTGIARIAAVAIHNASMHTRLMRQQRLEQDLRFAQQVQQSFLPLEPPEVHGFHFTRRYSPLFEVGGDFYDFIPLPDKRIGVTIGDVSGKGVSAALMMARLTSDIRYYAIAEQEPAQVLIRANASLLQSVQDNMFATVLYLVLDPTRAQMVVSNAGHVPPLVRRRDGLVQEVDEATNLALGVLANAEFDQTTVDLDVGDSVLLCTDGLLEAKNGVGEEFGFGRLEVAVSSAGANTALEDVLRELNRFTGPTPQYDDLTMVAFHRMH